MMLLCDAGNRYFLEGWPEGAVPSGKRNFGISHVLERLEVKVHLQLEVSWQEEYKILEKRMKQIFDTVTEVYRPQKRGRVSAERRHRPHRAGRKLASLPQKVQKEQGKQRRPENSGRERGKK